MKVKKVEIEITGQIGGNMTLRLAFGLYDNCHKTNWNGFILEYQDEDTAREDLNNACEKLAEDEPDMIEYKDLDFICYDASKAELFLTT